MSAADAATGRPRREGPVGGGLRIGSLAVDPPLLLAPMAGVTDRDFRLIVRRIGGVGVVSTEFLAAREVCGPGERWRPLAHFVEAERPVAIQIYGSEAATMAEAARVVEELGPDLCDVNMGCPANQILKGCAGAALMGDLRRAEEIVRAVRRQLSIPMTVKFRLGLDDTRLAYLELGRLCQDHGVDAVTLHARTPRQGFGGRAAWEHVARLTEALAIPVIGNGDVRTPEAALELFARTGCQGLMIGRGATRNPWVFRQIAAAISGGATPEPTLAARRGLILDHFRTVIAREPRLQALHKLRTFTGVYALGLPAGQLLRRRIQALAEPEDFLAAVTEHFLAIQEPQAA
jgi:tRNA-dihydrouridine synthase B